VFVLFDSRVFLKLSLSVVGVVPGGIVSLFIRWVMVHMVLFVAGSLVLVVVRFVSCFKFWVLDPRCEIVMEVEIMVVGSCVFVELEWVGLLVEVLFVIIFSA
jgi:hypothetical protein